MLERVTVDRDCLPAGSPVGSFVLHEVLERDDFSVFYRAGSSASESIVVIEEYWPQALSQRDPEGALVVRDSASQPLFAAGLAAFIQETEQLAQPSHPALVSLGPVWTLRQTAYRLRIEQAGEMLAKHLDGRERPPDERWLRAMAEPLLGALASVHGLGRLHGNVRPGNVVLLSSGQPVLLEFGAARAAVARAAPWLAVAVEADFAAPELQLYAVKPTPAADLYSLAALLVFCMFGEVPPPVRVAQRRGGAGRLMPLLEELQRRHPALHYSDVWMETLESALAFEPESRPQSAWAFREALARPVAPRPAPVVVPPIFRAVSPPTASTALKPPPGPFKGPTLMPATDGLYEASGDNREPTWQIPPQPTPPDDVLLHVPIQLDPPPPLHRREGAMSAPMQLSSDPPALSMPAPLGPAFIAGPERMQADPWPPRRGPIIRKTRRWPWVVTGALAGAAAMFAIALGVGGLADDARLAQVLSKTPSALGDLLPSIGSTDRAAVPAASAPGASPPPSQSTDTSPALAEPTSAAAAATGGKALPASAAAGTPRSATAVAPVVAEVAPRTSATAPNARVATEPPAREARPAIAGNPTTASPSGVGNAPAAACGARTNFSLYLCMERQCEQSQFYAHPQCVQWRRDNEP